MNVRSDRAAVLPNLFPAAFALWFASDVLESAGFVSAAADRGIAAVNGAVFLLLVVQIVFCQKYSRMELAAVGVITGMVALITACSSKLWLASLWMFIVAAKETRFEDTVRRVYRILLFMIPFIVLCSGAGLAKDAIIYRNGMVRHSLGFNHPNTLGMRVFQLVALRFYIRRRRLRSGDFLFLFAAVVFVYAVPNSQTAYFCLTALGAGVLADLAAGRPGSALSGTYRSCLVILAALFNAVSVLWSVRGVSGSAVLKKLDALLSVRFSVCHRAFQIFGVKLLGNASVARLTSGACLKPGSTERIFFDVGYMNLLLRFGILAYVLFSCAYIAEMLQCRYRSRGMLLLILFCYALYGVMEPGIYVLRDNVFLLSFAFLLYADRESGQQNGRSADGAE